MTSLSVIFINGHRGWRRGEGLVQDQVNIIVTKKHHDTIRDMMATSSHVFCSISRGRPNGYMAVGYLLFLQEQRKNIIKKTASSRKILQTCHLTVESEFSAINKGQKAHKRIFRACPPLNYNKADLNYNKAEYSRSYPLY